MHSRFSLVLGQVNSFYAVFRRLQIACKSKAFGEKQSLRGTVRIAAVGFWHTRTCVM